MSGWSDIDAFLAAGRTRRDALEAILGTASKAIGNYTNYIAHTRLDPFMRGNAWTKPAARRCRRPQREGAAVTDAAKLAAVGGRQR